MYNKVKMQSLRIKSLRDNKLKNTYGEASVRIGLAFMGVIGMFKELPKKEMMDSFDYSQLFDHSFFLE